MEVAKRLLVRVVEKVMREELVERGIESVTK